MNLSTFPAMFAVWLISSTILSPPDGLHNWFLFITAAGGAAAGVWSINRYIVKPMRGGVRAVKNFFSDVSSLRQLLADDVVGRLGLVEGQVMTLSNRIASRDERFQEVTEMVRDIHRAVKNSVPIDQALDGLVEAVDDLPSESVQRDDQADGGPPSQDDGIRS